MTGQTNHKTTDDAIHNKDHITLNKLTNLNKSFLIKHADESTSDDIFPTLKRPLPMSIKKVNLHQENDVKKDIIPKSIFPPTFSSRLVHKIPPNFTTSQLNPAVTDFFPKSDLGNSPPPVIEDEKTSSTISPSNSTSNTAEKIILNNSTNSTNLADVTKNTTFFDVTNNQSNSSLVTQQVTYIPLNQTTFNSIQTNKTFLNNQSDSTVDSTNQTLVTEKTLSSNETLTTNQTLPNTINNTERMSLEFNQSNIEPINITEKTTFFKSNQSNNKPINITEITPSLKSNQSNGDPLVASWRQYFPSFFPFTPSQNTNQENSQLRADQGKSKYDVTAPLNPGHTEEIKMGE